MRHRGYDPRIFAMHQTQARNEELREAQNPAKTTLTKADTDAMNAYRDARGGAALRALYASLGNDWQKTIQTIREEMKGQVKP